MDQQETSTDSTITTDSATPTDRDASEVIGIGHWEAQRRVWTQSSSSSASLGVKAKDQTVLDEGNLEGIHAALMDGRSFKQPMPLSTVVRILISGWITEGLWPSASFRPPASD